MFIKHNTRHFGSPINQKHDSQEKQNNRRGQGSVKSCPRREKCRSCVCPVGSLDRDAEVTTENLHPITLDYCQNMFLENLLFSREVCYADFSELSERSKESACMVKNDVTIYEELSRDKEKLYLSVTFSFIVLTITITNTYPYCFTVISCIYLCLGLDLNRQTVL